MFVKIGLYMQHLIKKEGIMISERKSVLFWQRFGFFDAYVTHRILMQW